MDNLFKNALKELTNIIDEIEAEEDVQYFSEEDTLALYELIDFNRLQLSKCRRSDDTLFTMLLPNKINQLTKADFNNKYCDMHICFTNQKRIVVNKYMMSKFISDKAKKD